MTGSTDKNKLILTNINMENTVSAVGIDVAKAMLSVCIRSRKGTERALVLRNIEADIKNKLVPALTGCKGRVVMESTGHYHWLPTLILTEAGHDVRVVNPILAKQYTSGNIRKVKTDPADASGLARMAEMADNLPPAFHLSPDKLHIRKKLGVISSISHHLNAMKASLASLKEANQILGIADSPMEEEMKRSIASLNRSLGHLEKEFVRESQTDEALRPKLALLESIPGVSPFCAALALHWFERLPGCDSKSWIGYAGLDISSRESGTWRGKCKLTKRGNSHLRARLYCAAWGAIMNDPQMKEYYDLLRSQGRSHVEALVIIARKIVRTMFMVLESGMPYDPLKFQVGKTQ